MHKKPWHRLLLQLVYHHRDGISYFQKEHSGLSGESLQEAGGYSTIGRRDCRTSGAVKTAAIGWERIFANSVSEKELTS